MDRYEGHQNALTIALNKRYYLAILMDRYEGPQPALSIGLHRSL
jgi:hypothetical protein